MKISSKLFFVLILFVFTLTVKAQTGKLFTTNGELSSSMVNFVYQDHDGVVWIATENGLNRYDGARFRTLANDESNPVSLPNNYVNSVFEDSQNNFFVSTMEGLFLYDRARDIFKRIMLEGKKHIATHANVQMVMQRHNGELLVAVSGYMGIYSMHVEKDTVKARYCDFAPPTGSMCNLLFEDSHHNLWMSLIGNGIYRYDGKRLTAAAGLPKKDFQAMCEDSRGHLYVGSTTDGLFVQDKPGTAFRKVKNTSNPGLPIKSLMAVAPGRVLIGTDGYGLKEYNRNTDRIENVPVNTIYLSADRMKVHSIMRDKDGNIWLGLFQKGVLLLPMHTNGFKLTGWRSATSRLGSSACIMSVMRMRDGTTLIGTDGDGIYAVTPQGALRHFPPVAADFKSAATAHSVPAIVTALYEDSKGNVYVGSFLQGMARFNPATGACQYITTLKSQNGQVVTSVNSFAEDRHGRLWIGSNGNGLLCLDTATGKISDWTKLPGTENQLYNKWINTVLVATDGRVYVGSFSGSSCLDPKRKNWKTYNGHNCILPNHVVYSLHEDAKHDIWAGTATGLVHMSTKDGSTKTYTTAEGLPSNLVTGIAPDHRGNLWLSTSHGLSCLNMRTMKFVNYYADDGLQGNEFSKNAVFADTEIFFGGTNGVTHFRPETIKTPHRNLQVRIAAMYIHDQMVTVGMKSGRYDITEVDVMKSKNFSLAHDDNSFSIEFTAMEFYNPVRISYSYSINGRQWTTLAPGVNRLSFSGLAPGTYKFSVRACDSGLYSKPLKFTVTIHPAWYASMPAFIIYVLLMAAAVWYIYRHVRRKYLMRQEMQEHIYQEQVKEAKLQFFINVSHEIRTPMQLIISPLQKLISSDNDVERQSQYTLIMRNARRILSLINQLMDIRKIDKGKMKLHFQQTDLNSFVADICHTFDYQMQRKDIDFTFRPAKDDITAWLDPKNFDKVVVNLLSNALKFTPEGGKITVTITSVDAVAADTNVAADFKSAETTSAETASDSGKHIEKYFELSVRDSGIGIKPDEKSRIFERFYQINNSITANTSGTGVGLNLVHELVTLHHGTITVNNNIVAADANVAADLKSAETAETAKGCTFTVRIPLGRGHLSNDEIVEGEMVTKIQRSDDVTSMSDDVALQEDTNAVAADFKSAETATRPKTRYKVIIAEDEADIREYIAKELATEFHVTTCADGLQAWDNIRRKKFDILISDIMMPGIDGLSLCRKVKQNIHTNTVPVILLTAKTLEEEKITGLDTGADAYITKPFNIDFLKTSVNNLLRNRSLLKNSFEGKQEQDVDVSNMQEESPNDKLMRRIMKVINDNISDPALNVDMISREVGISRVHLYRKLKELTNQSARDFLRNVRLKHAAELLKQGNSNVSRIAELTGFSSVTVFSHAFKELFGVSPSTYGKQEEHKEE